MDASLHLRAERADGASVGAALPLPRGRDPQKVKALLEKLLKAGAKEETADVLAALSIALAVKTLTAPIGSHSIDATQALIDEVKSKIALYQRFHDDSDRWVLLAPGAQAGDAVYPVPIDSLP